MLIAESVLARVLVLRGVAAADVPATQAEAQMHPRVADRQALLAPVRSAGLHVVDLVEVGADSHRADNAVGLGFLPVGAPSFRYGMYCWWITHQAQTAWPTTADVKATARSERCTRWSSSPAATNGGKHSFAYRPRPTIPRPSEGSR
jgi:hypothetical protein